ncbi:hypothetical protein OHC33_010518 [Knufia fluminis]|uniref:Uncharacterized protein n=1 Tax=Knufia fluminis TaxID=191047 RepID=A0AAN8I2D9_9EURO|nr:hypothetical protein OHC33_010518 [Knufia fluminis]
MEKLTSKLSAANLRSAHPRSSLRNDHFLTHLPLAPTKKKYSMTSLPRVKTKMTQRGSRFRCRRRDNLLPLIDLGTRGDAEGTPFWVKDEIAALQRLAEAKHKSQINVPHLLAAKCEGQESWSWVPHGFVCMILMQYCPGQPLDVQNFYSRPVQERDVIRESFKATLHYIVDFEASEPNDIPYEDEFNDLLEYYLWGLAGWQWRDNRLYKSFLCEENERPGEPWEDNTEEHAERDD